MNADKSLFQTLAADDKPRILQSLLRSFTGRYLAAAATGVTELCFPPICVFCHGHNHSAQSAVLHFKRTPGQDICIECRRLFGAVALPNACMRCGFVLPSVSRYVPGDEGAILVNHVCRKCTRKPGKIVRLFTLGGYREALREAVVACKRTGYLPLATNLGELLGLRIRESLDGMSIGAVTYIPSHWTKRVRRGGVPTQEMARRVASVVGAPLVRMLVSTKKTEKQGMLTDKQRRQNVRGAFAVKKGYALNSQRILVVDDVWTTGSTLREAAEQLSQGYDAEIFAAVVARAVGTHSV